MSLSGAEIRGPTGSGKRPSARIRWLDDDDFGAFSGTVVLPGDLTVREIAVGRDPRELLSPPITADDVAAADQFAAAENQAVALSSNGDRLLHVTADRLRVVGADSGEPHGPSIDLRPLRAALQLPEDVELWQRLAAAYAVPAALSGASPAQAREAIARTFGDDPSDDELAAAIEVARGRPQMPKRLPLLADQK